MPLPQAVIFDFDGLLVDTEWAIYQSWVRVFDREGHPLPLEIFVQCVGAGYTHWNPGDHLETLTGQTYDWDGINAARQEEIHADLAHSGLMPGALELLDYLQCQGIPLAVASSSSHRWVDSWLDKLGIRDRFRTVVCRDDGYPVKPDPSLYRAAAAQLGTDPRECLALEDSQNGATAAKTAGMRVFAVPNRMTFASDFGIADRRLESLCDALPLFKAME